MTFMTKSQFIPKRYSKFYKRENTLELHLNIFKKQQKNIKGNLQGQK